MELVDLSCGYSGICGGYRFCTVDLINMNAVQLIYGTINDYDNYFWVMVKPTMPIKLAIVL